jgi:hypothetical protein
VASDDEISFPKIGDLKLSKRWEQTIIFLSPVGAARKLPNEERNIYAILRDTAEKHSITRQFL